MKANAPEKIYLVNDDLNIKREWYKNKQVGFETTEYTRTDAFIEKACEWIEDNINEYTFGEDIQFTLEHTYNIDIFNQTKFVMDFRKYMKGE